MIPRLVLLLAILCAASWTVTLMLWALHVRLTQRYILLRSAFLKHIGRCLPLDHAAIMEEICRLGER